MIHNAIRCDVCKKEKAAVNHWYIIAMLDVLVRVSTIAKVLQFNGVTLAGVVVSPWNDDLAKIEGVKHVCGQEHATALISRWMSYGNFEEFQPKKDTKES